MSSAAPLQAGSVLVTHSGQPALARLWAGQGSYSRVYRGAFGIDGVPCALKLPKADLPEAESLVRSEAEILDRVHGPSVVRLLGTGEWDGRPFLALEWVEGETLHDLIRSRRRLPLRQSLQMLERLAEALTAFHAQGLPHGDVRTENILCPSTASAVVIDPHALPVGNVPPPSIPNDLTAAAAVLYESLTGTAYADGAPPLGPALGFNRAVSSLWDRARTAAVTAPELLTEARKVRTAI